MSLIRWDRVDELAAGRSDKEIAQDAGFSAATLSNMRGGRVGFEARNLFGLAKALKCSVAYITGESDTPEVSKSGLSDEGLRIAAKLNALPGRRRAEAEQIIEVIRKSEEDDQRVLGAAIDDVKGERGENVANEISDFLDRFRRGDIPRSDGLDEENVG